MILGRFKIEIWVPSIVEDVNAVSVLYITTEANAWGAVAKKWYDGRVTPFRMKVNWFHSIVIPQVKSYEYVRCTHEPFYKCLGAGFNGNCSLISLPNVPLCNDTSQQIDKQALFSGALHTFWQMSLWFLHSKRAKPDISEAFLKDSFGLKIVFFVFWEDLVY